VSAGSGYFQGTPRGVVFIKSVDGIDTQAQTATFQVSSLPDGDPVTIANNMSGFFQIADQARTFAGNNTNEQSQIELQIEVGTEFLFDGGNQGFDGDPEDPLSNEATVVGYTGTSMTVFTSEGLLDYYTGAMIRYSTDGNVANGLQQNRTYFVTNFSQGASAGLYNMSIAELPGESPIDISGGSGTQQFNKIGVSVDKDIVHIRNSNFEQRDMLEYVFPENGNFGSDFEQRFYFVNQALDSHNYSLTEDVGFRPIVATGGNFVTDIYTEGRAWRIHTFTSTGNSTFTVSDTGPEPEVEYLLVAGGGGSGNDDSGGGGGGGMLEGEVEVSSQSYTITVGAGGNRGGIGTSQSGFPGGNSSAFGITATGGGGGGFQGINGGNGGSGGGGGHFQSVGGLGIPGQGFNGGRGETFSGGDWAAGGGGGASQAGTNGINANNNTGKGGDGRISNITGVSVRYAGGGGGQSRRLRVPGGLGGGGAAGTESLNAQNGTNGLGGGGGGGGNDASVRLGGLGGSGVVIIRYPLTGEPTGEFIIASGGDVSVTQESGTLYAVHQFRNTGSSTFQVQSTANVSANNEVEYFIVAGGGSGGVDNGGGGGAGGVLQGSTNITSTGNYNVVVGPGGAAGFGSPVPGRTFAAPNDGPGFNGSNSSVFGLVAVGGSGATGWVNATLPSGSTTYSGGSGGGQSASTSTLNSRGVGQGTAGQGNNGGPAIAAYSGGGGGAGGPGQQGNSVTGGAGGIGIFSSITGTSTYYAGGGTGGWDVAASRFISGTPASNNGVAKRGNVQQPELACAPNTGHGGHGGNHNDQRSGAAGSGIVVIRYPIGQTGQ
jgi:hypothetical protein